MMPSRSMTKRAGIGSDHQRHTPASRLDAWRRERGSWPGDRANLRLTRGCHNGVNCVDIWPQSGVSMAPRSSDADRPRFHTVVTTEPLVVEAYSGARGGDL